MSEMKPQPENQVASEHEGERYLAMLGLGEYADTDIPTDSGSIKARDFLEVCGEHALPVLKGFEMMDTTDPQYEATKGMLQKLIGQYIQGDSSG